MQFVARMKAQPESGESMARVPGLLPADRCAVLHPGQEPPDILHAVRASGRFASAAITTVYGHLAVTRGPDTAQQ